MTRGTIHIILPDKIRYSRQFNGDMDLDGHGTQVIEKLSDVGNEEDSKKAIINFNNENFKYENFYICEIPYIKDNMVLKCGEEPGDPAFSDYTYWKNLSGKIFTFVDQEKNKVILENNAIAVFHFCSRYLKMYPLKKS